MNTKNHNPYIQNSTSYKGGLGFTLIEIMVAVALFSVVMVIAVGALMTIIDANRKAHSVQSVVNNLSFAMESLSRTARVGTTYYCRPGNANPTPVPGNAMNNPRNCSSGGNFFAFEPFNGTYGDVSDQVIYRLNGTRMERSIDGGATFVGLTPANVIINKLRFYVRGSSPTDRLQPEVLIVLDGEVSTSLRTKTEFYLQTSITQRIPDIP